MSGESETIYLRELVKQYAQMHGLTKAEAVIRLIKKLKKL